MKHSLHYFLLASILQVSALWADGQNKYPGISNDNKKTYRDIPYSKQIGSGPRYWIAYEYCWMHNEAIPEDIWKQNIDWVADNFKNYGYDMISNDGWIEAAQTVNENGFITKYNSDWEHGFDYWAQYVAGKGMKMGVYYNPLWMTKTAYKENLPVTGTTYTCRDIAGPKSFNSELRWVDVDKPGAREWVQGYVKYFKAIGANFLRIDFLENYENNYGHEKYEKALHWMREAADSTMLLSLVMPNCFNHAATELKYGDMIRISDDCFNGGWDFVSDRRRGMFKRNWPQYGNAFDGFISFADIGGRGQMVLDGDFTRINTLKDDNEKKSQVSLLVMTGSPIAIADQYYTIGNNAWIYQNEELLALNDQGFAGKPLSYDIHDAANSSRWVGQLPNGDWIVGLFNRENSSQNRGIDFVKELGLKGRQKYELHDLWQHKSAGSYSKSFSARLAPHECIILKISNDTRKYEMEVASLMKGARKGSEGRGFSGSGYVDLREDSAAVLIAVEAAASGEYQLTLQCKNAGAVNDGSAIEIKCNDISTSVTPASQNKWMPVNSNIHLNKGINYIYITRRGRTTADCKLDYIEIR